ncbi:hypothetical protein C7212DRAFT_294634 [Tuber magnatum]|uniref:Uncharacterized protein n=1 Tax=Tuber magnatum TaxID=42249 RepID=A0A317SP28_9PEZI|nr:hypothetical protein C7212DRAFT_294634 [Tuber magnatum]
MHVDELRHSLTVYEKSHDLNVKTAPSIQTLLSSCLGLVTFDRETSTVRLVHTTGMAPRGDISGAVSGLSSAAMPPRSTWLALNHTNVLPVSIPKHETAVVTHGSEV